MADRGVGLVLCVQHNTQGGQDPDRWRCRCAQGGRGARTKAPMRRQDLRRRIDRKAKSDKAPRFWGLWGQVAQRATRADAYQPAQRNGGAPGLDGQTCGDIEAGGLERFLAASRADV